MASSRQAAPVRFLFRALACFVLTLVPSSRPVVAEPGVAAEGPGTRIKFEQAVDDSIDRGVEYLLDQIGGPSGWIPSTVYPAGQLAVQLYALLKSDVSYLHPTVVQGLRLLDGYPLEKVYSVSLSLMVYDAVLGQMEEGARTGGTLKFLAKRKPKKSRKKKEPAPSNSPPPPNPKDVQANIRRCLEWLLVARLRNRGAWGYVRAPRGGRIDDDYFDHSNTQFAVLALGVAARRGLKVPISVWQAVADQCIVGQERTGPRYASRPRFRLGDSDDDGSLAGARSKRESKTVRVPPGERIFRGAKKIHARGWAYADLQPDSKVTFSMSCAMQSTALLAHMYLRRRGGSRVDALERSLRDGYAWLTRILESDQALYADTYALYSLEKVGDIGEVETFGEVAWYEKGGRMLIAYQRARGPWGSFGSVSSRHKTSMALLYLGRASSFEKKRALVRYTGGWREGEKSFSQRYWVHLQSIGASIPMVRFFRQLRYRPDGRLMEMADELIDAYDPEFMNELVMFFSTLKLSPFKIVRQKGRSALAKLTGLEDGAAADFQEWVSHWERAVRAALRKDIEQASLLRVWLRHTPSKPLKLKLVWALQQLRARTAIGELIDLMAADDIDLRRTAYDAAVVVSGKNLPFEPAAEKETRARQLAVWRNWWDRETGVGDEDEDEE